MPFIISPPATHDVATGRHRANPVALGAYPDGSPPGRLFWEPFVAVGNCVTSIPEIPWRNCSMMLHHDLDVSKANLKTNLLPPEILHQTKRREPPEFYRTSEVPRRWMVVHSSPKTTTCTTTLFMHSTTRSRGLLAGKISGPPAEA